MGPTTDLNRLDAVDTQLPAENSEVSEEGLAPHDPVVCHDGAGTPASSSLDWEFLHTEDEFGSSDMPDSAEALAAVLARRALFRGLEEEGEEVTSAAVAPRCVEVSHRSQSTVSSPSSVRSLNADGLVSVRDAHSDSESHFTNDLIAAGELDEVTSGPLAVDALSAHGSLEHDLPALLEEGAAPEPAEPRPAPAPLALPTRAYLTAADEAAALVGRLSRVLASLGAVAERRVVDLWRQVLEALAVAQGGVDRVGLAIAPMLASLRTSLEHGKTATLAALVSGKAGSAALVSGKVPCVARRLLDNWPALALAAGCAVASAALYHSMALNVKLAARLSQREGELAELVSRVMSLQRTMTRQHSVRGVPMIAHTTCTAWHHHSFGMV